MVQKTVTLRFKACFRGVCPGATYAVHLKFIEKLLADTPLVIIEFFSPSFETEPLRANIDQKSPFMQAVGHFGQKFEVEGDDPTPPAVCARLDRTVNALQPCR